MSAPDISVCIANYNGGQLLLECLASVYAQHGDFTFEVIVHDDCSTDGSLGLVREHFPCATVLTSHANLGFCVSNNRMASAAKGRYLLLLNNDALLRKQSLQRLFHFAEAGADDRILGLPQHALIDGASVDHGYLLDPFINPVPIERPGVHDAAVATGACLWVPKRIWNAIGGFPEWFESVAEDIFLCVAARLLGYRVTILEGPAFDHWIGRNLGGGKLVDRRMVTTVRRRALSERNKTFVMLACYPTSILMAVLPLHFIFLFLEALFLLLSGTGVGKVSGIYRALLPGVWRHRHDLGQLRASLQRRRRCSSAELFRMTDWLPHKLRMLVRHGIPKVH